MTSFIYKSILSPAKPLVFPLENRSSTMIEDRYISSTAAETYYLWNEVGDGVDQILEPKDLPDIYKALEVLEAGDESKIKTRASQP